MATLRLNTHITAFDDLPANNSPNRRNVDWGRFITDIPVTNPSSEVIRIDPLSEVTIFDGTRVLGVDGVTEFDLTLSTLSTIRYRLKHNGVGAAPAFRTDRALTLSGGDVTTVLNANSTLTVTHSAGAVFGAVAVADIVLIPGAATGDTALFDPLNEGEWTVLSATATTLVLARLPGATFSGKSEPLVTIATDDQFQAFSSTGVQVGDTLDISAGFSAATQRSYKIITVAADYVEFTSTLALAEESDIVTGVAGVTVYSVAKKVLYIETNQAIALKLNGDTSENTRVEPFIASDDDRVGTYLKVGTTFSLKAKNRSTVQVKVLFISAE